VKVVLRGANKLGIAVLFLLFVFGNGISMLVAHVTERGRMKNCCHAAVCVLVTPETILSHNFFSVLSLKVHYQYHLYFRIFLHFFFNSFLTSVPISLFIFFYLLTVLSVLSRLSLILLRYFPILRLVVVFVTFCSFCISFCFHFPFFPRCYVFFIIVVPTKMWVVDQFTC
jgi:hypothetical protein